MKVRHLEKLIRRLEIKHDGDMSFFHAGHIDCLGGEGRHGGDSESAICLGSEGVGRGDGVGSIGGHGGSAGKKKLDGRCGSENVL